MQQVNTVNAPMIREGFRQVTKEEFFATVGKLNVHPYPEGPWTQEYGYLTRWKMLNSAFGEVVGISDSGGEGIPGASTIGRYWVKV